MEKISDIQKQITETEKQLDVNKKAIQAVEERIGSAQKRSSEIGSEINTLRERRQAVLANGEDSSGLSKKIKEITDENELKNDEVSGLNAQLSKLEIGRNDSTATLLRLKGRIPELRTLTLAQEYNKLALQLAGVVRELNEIHWEIDRACGSGFNGRVVFSLKEGAVTRIPKLYFDEDGLKVEPFLARHPGVYPANMPVNERCFYDWDTHFAVYRGELINGKLSGGV